MRLLSATLALCALVGCATLTRDSLDQAYGPADPTRHDQPRTPASGGVSYRAEVQPILEQRCVVCHGCYDAPCQLKLGAWEGIARGASTAVVVVLFMKEEMNDVTPMTQRSTLDLLPPAMRWMVAPR